MEIAGQQVLAATRDAVWAALNDPAVLQRCLPGCESVERTAPERFKVVIAAAIGPLRARMSGALQIADANAPASCTIVFDGQGGAVGFGSGRSAVTLTETPDGTLLAYTAQAQLGGKLAQVGSRLIDSIARKMADDFFGALRSELRPEAAAPSAPAAAAMPDAATPEAPPTSSRPAAQPPASSPQAPPNRASRDMPSPHLVPAWWLAVAALLGSATTLAGVWVRF